MNKLAPGSCVFISAKKGLNIDELKKVLYERAKEIHLARFPYNDFFYQNYEDLTLGDTAALDTGIKKNDDE